jgi:peptide/nickel transport system substrate-binding protein
MIPSRSRLRGALLACGVALATAVTACGGGGGGGGNGTAANLGTYKPVKGTTGGQLVYSDWESVQDLNVLSSTAATTQEAADVIWAFLWEWSPDNKPIPDLVSEIPSTANGDVKEVDSTHMDITIKLKPGLKWSDGTPLTVKDLKFTVDAICDPATGAASQVGYNDIASTDIKNDSTLVWHLGPDPTGKRCGNSSPTTNGIDSSFLVDLDSEVPVPQSALGSIPHAQWATSSYFTKLPTPTDGPYMVQSFTPGSAAQVVMVPNPHYFDGRSANDPAFGHKPYLNKLIYKIYGNKQAQIAGLSSGDTDLGLDLIAADLPTLPSQNQNVHATGLLDEYINFNEGNNTTGCAAQQFAPTCGTPTPWKDDATLRKALNIAIDRQSINKNLVGGIGQIFDGPILPSLSTYYNASLNPTPDFSISQANSMLDSDGWVKGADGIRTKNGRKLQFTISTTTGNNQRAAEEEQLMATWKQIGASVTTKNFPAGDFFNDFKGGGINATGQFDISLYANNWSPDPNAFCIALTSDQIPTNANPAGQNWDRINDPAIDKACHDGANNLDVSKRQASYNDLQTEYHKYQPWGILYVRPDVFSHDTSFGNFFPSVNTCLAVCTAADWYRKGAS